MNVKNAWKSEVLIIIWADMWRMHMKVSPSVGIMDEIWGSPKFKYSNPTNLLVLNQNCWQGMLQTFCFSVWPKMNQETGPDAHQPPPPGFPIHFSARG